MNNSFMIQLCNYLDEVDEYEEIFKEKSIDYLQGRMDQYNASFRANFDLILGTSSEITAIQSVLENKLKGERNKK